MNKQPPRSAHKIEIEIKIACESIEKLQPLGELRLEVPRHFEDNWMLDTTDERLKKEKSALRVRFTQGKGLITFKGLSKTDSEFKAREELETETSDPYQMVAIFEKLGYQPFFRYQKYRTVYKLELSTGETLKVMFDETPIGNFVELEGTEESVKYSVNTLRLKPEDYITDTYISIQVERCQQQGLPLQDLLFAENRPESRKDSVEKAAVRE
ncbi:MAG: class IV adenylate cyclase [Blastocatellia bacterium]|nr:class IV adenylate cyclase [Blastocatellia bacterium]